MKEHDATEIAYNNGKAVGRAEAFDSIRKKVDHLYQQSEGTMITRSVLRDVLQLIDQAERGE